MKILGIIPARFASTRFPGKPLVDIKGKTMIQRVYEQSMQANLDKLKPVIDAHDKDYDVLMARDLEMEKLIHEFKNSLLIEKIKMDTWENKKK